VHFAWLPHVTPRLALLCTWLLVYGCAEKHSAFISEPVPQWTIDYGCCSDPVAVIPIVRPIELRYGAEDLKWTQSGDKLAWIAKDDSGTALYIYSLDSGQLSTLRGKEEIVGFDWHPKAYKLIMGLRQPGLDSRRSHIKEVKLVGSTVEADNLVAHVPGRVGRPAYSSDGEKVVFTADTGEAVMVAARDGAVRIIVAGDAFNQLPVWLSQDAGVVYGKAVFRSLFDLFERSPKNYVACTLLGAQGKKEIPIDSSAFLPLHFGCFPGDSTRMIYVKYPRRERNSAVLYAYDFRTGIKHLLLDFREVFGEQFHHLRSLSASRQRPYLAVALQNQSAEMDGIWILSLETKVATRILDFSTRLLALSDDSDKLAYADPQGDICVVNVPGCL